MEGSRASVGLQCPQRMVIVDPMITLSKISDEETESADNHLHASDDYLENTNLSVVDAKVSQIIASLVLFYLGKQKCGLTRVEMVDHMEILLTEKH